MRLNTETILSFALGFVVIWFGYNEVTNPAGWAGYVPAFLSNTDMVNNLVLAHGVILILAGLALVFNFRRKFVAGVVALMLLSIIYTVITGEGLTETAVRDIGLFGMALALALTN